MRTKSSCFPVQSLIVSVTRSAQKQSQTRAKKAITILRRIRFFFIKFPPLAITSANPIILPFRLYLYTIPQKMLCQYIFRPAKNVFSNSLLGTS